MRISGQSIIEILVAVGLGAILVIGGAALIGPALKTGQNIGKTEGVAVAGKELADNLKVWTERDWHNILSLATGTANLYYLNTTSSLFSAATGTESVHLSTSTTLTRYFYLTDIYRDALGNATSASGGNKYDPSTKQVTIVTIPAGVSTSSAPMFSLLLTRNFDKSFNQIDWSGGSGQSGPFTVTPNTFTNASSNITFAAASGLSLTAGTSTGPGAIAFVQGMLVPTTTATVYNTVISSTFASNVGAGDAIIVAASMDNVNPAASSPVTDTRGNTYTQIGSTLSAPPIGASYHWAAYYEHINEIKSNYCDNQNSDVTRVTNPVSVTELSFVSPNTSPFTPSAGADSTMSQYHADHSTTIANGGSTSGDASIFMDVALPANTDTSSQGNPECNLPLQHILQSQETIDTYDMSGTGDGFEVKPSAASLNGAGLSGPTSQFGTNTFSFQYTVPASTTKRTALYYAKNSSAGADKITFTASGSSATGLALAAAEFSNVATSSLLDTSATATGISTNAITGSINPALAGELLIGAGTFGGTASTVTAGSGLAFTTTPWKNYSFSTPLALEYQVLSGSPTVSPGITYDVSTNWTMHGALFKPLPASSSTPVNGVLQSATFDSGSTSGAQLNSITWHGTQPVGSFVEFQFAVSNSSSGPWTFVGPGGSTSTFYAPAAGTPGSLDLTAFNNFRYFRYAVTLGPNPSSSVPTVTSVTINLSP